jgi:hypothetical protein
MGEEQTIINATEASAPATSAGSPGATELQGAATETALSTDGAGVENSAGAGTEGVATEALAAGGEALPAGVEVPGARKVTGEERVTEALSRAQAAEEKADRLELQIRERLEPQAPPFAPDDLVQSIQGKIVAVASRKREIETMMEVSPGEVTRGIMDEYLQADEWLTKARHGLSENEKARAAFFQQQQEQQQQQQRTHALNVRLDEAAKVIQTDQKIPADVMESGRKWFQERRLADKVLDAKYRELAENRGAYHAVEFAVGYVKENMGKEAKSALAAQEEAKQTTVGSAASGGAAGKAGGGSVWELSKDDFEAQVRRVKGLD